MNYSNKIVTTIPVDEIWNSTKVLDAKKIAHLTADDIRSLLSQTKVIFVTADVGDKLKWVDVNDCFSFWKSEVQKHVASNPDCIDLDKFPDEYAYLASRWTSSDYPIILLEKFH